MMPEATAESEAESEAQPAAAAPGALSVLQARLREGISASPLCVAILGWLCDVDTDPYLVVIRRRGGQVILRLSDEKITAPFGPLTEFLSQITVLCAALELSEAQAQEVTDAARQRLA